MGSLKHILLFGAGKSATVLIDYLKKVADEKKWQVTVADSNLAAAAAKVGVHQWVHAVQLDIHDTLARQALVQRANVVISMMPPALHYLIAMDCIAFSRHLLTASYVDDKIRDMETMIRDKQVLFLCEMGLDPGIDHMSAMQLVHRIQSAGGVIHSFKSHCGGLVAPESDNNPWHYKISWSPRNVVLAGKAGAVWREKAAVRAGGYEDIFADCRQVQVNGLGSLAYYPNRDSLGYIATYGLGSADTFIRTTLRHPDFCKGWKQVVALKLTDEVEQYDTNGLTVPQFLQQHCSRHAVHFSMTDMNDALLKTQFQFLGFDDDTLVLDRGNCTAADVMQFLLEKKLVLQEQDKDMIVMLHEIGYEINGQASMTRSCLVVKGEDQLHTAMAKTVGLPLGIAAVLLLEGNIQETGLHIPVIPAIYEPVLAVLASMGIAFTEL